MTVTEAAAYLGVSRPTLLRMVWRKELTPRETPNPILRRQRKYTFTRAEIERLKCERQQA